MADHSEQLARMERRQESLVAAVTGLFEVVQMTNAMLADLMEWIKKPPSRELPDLLAALVQTVHEMRDEIREMPEKVARAVIDGELDGRG